MHRLNKSDVKSEVAIFAGGNFQHMLEVFSEVPGVLEVISGYTGGWKHNPTYEEVATGETGHFEAVMIIYDSIQNIV
ncbi:MAG: peptide-methionine (S)-S-oxide reductase [Candidatus Jordarchaeales archaeon]